MFGLVSDFMFSIALVFITYAVIRQNKQLRRRVHALETAVRTNARNIRLGKSCLGHSTTSGILTIHKGSVSSSVRATFKSDR